MIHGKGMYIWNIRNTEGGNVDQIVRVAVEAGLSHALVKIADGTTDFNGTAAIVLTSALQDAGIEVWGWQYIYGAYPSLEAITAARRIRETGVSGFVVNAEKEMKGKPAQASAYMTALKANTSVPLGLSTYRWPSYHPDFPFKEFLAKVDVNLPQVYWLQAHNPSYQLERCIREYANPALPQVPIIPTGAAFVEYGWYPTPEEVRAFMGKAQSSCEGCNFWVWENTRKNLPNIWEVIRLYDWANPPVPEPLPEVDVPKVTVLADTLNVRSGPGTGYPIVRKVRKGDVIPARSAVGPTVWAEIGDNEWVAVSVNGVKYASLEIG